MRRSGSIKACMSALVMGGLRYGSFIISCVGFWWKRIYELVGYYETIFVYDDSDSQKCYET